MTNRKAAVTRRVAAVAALVLAFGAAWAVPASADDAVAAAEGDQLTVVLNGSFPASHYTGLQAGNFDLRVSNMTSTPMNDVYIELDSVQGAQGGMELGTTGMYANSLCSQTDGAGTPILCGPLYVAAGSSATLSSTGPKKGVSIAPGHDFLLDNGNVTLDVTARAYSARADVSGSADVIGSMYVVTDMTMQTAITFSAPGGSAGTVPTVGRYEVSSPQELDMHWRIVNAGYGSVNDMTATMTVPTGLEVTSIPGGCALSGQELTCVRDYAKWGTAKTFVVPVRVTSGLAVGTELVIDDLHGSVYSPNEPVQWPMWNGSDTWDAKVVNGPYTLVITEAAEAVVTDVAVSHTHVDDVTAGTTVSLPFGFDDLDESTGAAEVTATIDLAGMDFESVSTTIEGCTAVDATVTCSFGDMAALQHIEGTVDVALPQVDEGSFTVTASVTTATEDRDPSNNTLTDEYVITADVVDPEPEPSPGPGEETTGPDGGTDTGTDDGTTTEQVRTGVLAVTGGSTLPLLAGAGVLLLGGTAAVLTRRRATARH